MISSKGINISKRTISTFEIAVFCNLQNKIICFSLWENFNKFCQTMFKLFYDMTTEKIKIKFEYDYECDKNSKRKILTIVRG